MSRKRRRRKPRGPAPQARTASSSGTERTSSGATTEPATGAPVGKGGDRKDTAGTDGAGRATRRGETSRERGASGPTRRDQGQARPGGLFGGSGVPSPFPPFGVTMARGMRAVGASAVLLTATFVSALATWGAVVVLGADAPLRYLIVEMAASPLHVFFDVDLIFRLGGTSTDALVATAALGAVRAVTFGALLLLIGAVLRGEGDVRQALRPFPKVVLSLFAVYVAEVAVVVGAARLLVGLLGPAGSLVLPLVALHFLSFVPVVIALERTSARDGLVRGLRAARLPAGRHLIMMLVYFMFSLYLVSGSPPLTPATPSVLGWAFVLGVTFVHVSVTAALAYRWLAVRDEAAVVAAPSRARGADAAAARRSR